MSYLHLQRLLKLHPVVRGEVQPGKLLSLEEMIEQDRSGISMGKKAEELETKVVSAFRDFFSSPSKDTQQSQSQEVKDFLQNLRIFVDFLVLANLQKGTRA